MPIPVEFTAPFYCNQFYHLVFKSIDGLLLFKNDANRFFFLEKFYRFTKPVFNCMAWCQLNNHVHVIVAVKEHKLLKQSITEIPDKLKTVAMKKFILNTVNELIIDELIERQINRFMVSYANAYNIMYKRTGSLFQSFRRSVVNGDVHLQQAIIYVHANAQKHGVISDYRTYPYSSLNEILNGKSLLIDTDKVINFFGGTGKFIEQHDHQVAYYYSANWPSSKIEVD